VSYVSSHVINGGGGGVAGEGGGCPPCNLDGYLGRQNTAPGQLDTAGLGAGDTHLEKKKKTGSSGIAHETHAVTNEQNIPLYSKSFYENNTILKFKFN
jgi:hypothetical protein